MIEIEKPKVNVDNTFYGISNTINTKNKRRSLEDLEDEF